MVPKELASIPSMAVKAGRVRTDRRWGQRCRCIRLGLNLHTRAMREAFPDVCMLISTSAGNDLWGPHQAR